MNLDEILNLLDHVSDLLFDRRVCSCLSSNRLLRGLLSVQVIHLLGFIWLSKHVLGNEDLFIEGGWEGPQPLLRSMVALETVDLYEHAVEVDHAGDEELVDDDGLAGQELLPHVAEQHHGRAQHEGALKEGLHLVLRVAYAG